MRTSLFGIIYLFSFLSFKVSKDPAFDYVRLYSDIAKKEMFRTGIPASIKLAQASLESENGKSLLSSEHNNHFGIKCGKDWTGKSFYKIDDDVDQEGKVIESCFRAYDSAEDCFKAHSEFLKDPKKSGRYGSLFLLDKQDYVAWAHGLRSAGYASDPNYPAKLIRIIEKYELYKLDGRKEKITIPISTEAEVVVNNDTKSKTDAKKDSPLDKTVESNRIKTNKPIEEKVVLSLKKIKINDAEAIIVNKNVSVGNLALHLNKKVSQLLAYNEMLYGPDQIVFEGSNIFLEKKNKDLEGKKKTHIVKKGETIEIISNLYGIRAHSLYIMNKIPRGNQPLEGETLNLKEKVDKKLAPKFKAEVKQGKILFSMGN